MKLEFEKIKIKNFLSVGSVPLEFSYKPGVHLVTGKINGKSVRNGCGKSLLFTDALVFALFGKSVRDINLDQMVNSIIGEKCEVTLWLSINDIPYRIERGIKPGYLRIYKNNSEESDELGNKKDAQKNFERKLGITYLSFKNMITQNINSSKPFFDMKADERRMFLEDIINLNVYGKMFELIKKEHNHSKNNKKVLEAEYVSTKKILENKQNTFDKIEERKSTFDITKKEQLTTLNNKLLELHNKKQSIEISDKDFDGIKEKINTKLQQIISQQAKHEHIVEDTLTNIKRNKTKISKIKENPVCPLCNNPTSSEHSEEHITELQTEIGDYEKTIEQSKSILQKCTTAKSELNIKLKKLNSLIQQNNDAKSDIQKINLNIKNIETQIEELKNKTFELENIITEDDIEKAKKSVEDKAKELNAETENLVYSQRLKELLGDKGIKNYIIRQIIPLLNKHINEYLLMLNATYSTRFDENLNESLKSRNCQDFNYKNFSSGEKKRIDLALIFTLIDIAKARKSVDCNVLVLDEVLDTSLCSDGTGSFISFLTNEFKRKYPSMAVYVITHKSDITEESFDSVIELEKVNEFTKLVGIKNI